MQELADAPPSLESLAERLDCLTEAGFIRLTGITSSTADTWRKRHEGPAFVRAGNTVLYPRVAVVEWLSSRLRERKTVSGKAAL